MIILRSSNWRSLDFHDESKCYRDEESERYIFILLRLTLNYETSVFLLLLQILFMYIEFNYVY